MQNTPIKDAKRLDRSCKRKYKPRATMLSNSEVMTICIAFHQSGYRSFKHFYLNYVFKNIFGKLFGGKGYISKKLTEELNDKNILQVEHSRHRSVWNFMVNLVCALIAYTYQNKKPGINFGDKDLVAMIY